MKCKTVILYTVRDSERKPWDNILRTYLNLKIFFLQSEILQIKFDIVIPHVNALRQTVMKSHEEKFKIFIMFIRFLSINEFFGEF